MSTHIPETFRRKNMMIWTLFFILKPNKIYIAVFFCYLRKLLVHCSHMYSGIHWTSHFIQGNRKTRQCLTGHPVLHAFHEEDSSTVYLSTADKNLFNPSTSSFFLGGGLT